MRADNNGVSINYDVHGDGRPVVLLHGFPDSGRLWRNQVPALVDAGFKVVVPDLRGFGASDKPADVNDYNLIFVATDIGAVLDDAGVEKAHVVGHDFGAAVAWAMGADLTSEQCSKMPASRRRMTSVMTSARQWPGPWA